MNGSVGNMKSKLKCQKELRLVSQHGLVSQRQQLTLLINRGGLQSSILVGDQILGSWGAPTAKQLAGPELLSTPAIVSGMRSKRSMLQDGQVTHLTKPTYAGPSDDQWCDAAMPSGTS